MALVVAFFTFVVFVELLEVVFEEEVPFELVLLGVVWLPEVELGLVVLLVTTVLF